MPYTSLAMPELPEVETIKNELSPLVVGQRFTQVTICDPKLVCGISVEELGQGLVGQTIQSIERRGKYLIFNLSGGRSVIMHLRMTGTLLLNPRVTSRYARAVFRLSNGTDLVFNDQRRLGLVWLVKDASTVIARLGPEPLAESFTPDVLAGLLEKHRIPIKATLLDQSIIAGIGNMYADEALFAARIHPLKKADALSPEEVATLCHHIGSVLRSAISGRGASVGTYVRPEGQLGSAQFHFKVAHRYGEPCPACGTAIKRISVRNRGTYFCSNCQRLTSRR